MVQKETKSKTKLMVALTVAVIFIIQLCVPFFIIVSNAGSEVTVIQMWNISSTTADKVTATLYSNGELVISTTGTGKIKAFTTGNSPFYENEKIKSIKINEGVTVIGNYAFQKCSNLESIKLPNSITNIGKYAFKDCSNLVNTNIPESVTIIGVAAFSGCSSLTSIKIPENITTLGTYIFSECSSLKNVTISEGTKTISGYMFQNCSSLTSITIPNSVTTIGAAAFSGCSSLKDITISEGIKNIQSNTFKNCSSLTNMTIPNSVTVIGGYAFSGCTNLTSIIIPSSVTNIGAYAFSECGNLTSITIPESVTTVGTGIFSECSSLKNATISEGAKTISNYMFQNCSNLTNIEMPSTLTRIGQYAFSGCSTLLNVTISNGVGYISDYAFSECSSLTRIEIPESVTSIGSYAFSGCNTLSNVTISNGVGYISDYAFSGCSSLSNITIPSSLNSIGVCVFHDCNLLETINVSEENETYSSADGIVFNIDQTELICYPAGKKDKTYELPLEVQYIQDGAFEGCINLENINVSEENEIYSSVNGVVFDKEQTVLIIYPAGKKDESYEVSTTVYAINYYAFINCVYLKNIDTKEVEEIYTGAFYKCTALETVTMPNVGYIEEQTFFGCTSLKNVNIPNLCDIYQKTFEGCTSLEEINLPEIVSIDIQGFMNCTSLKSINLPKLEVLGEQAFLGCTSLKILNIPILSDISSETFKGCISLEKLDLPNTTYIRNKAFEDCTSLKNVILYKEVTIGTDVFLNAPVTIYCKIGSKAETYAKAKNIAYSTEGPKIDFDKDGNNSYTKNETVIVTVTNEILGVKEDSLYYAISNSNSQIPEFTETFNLEKEIELKDLAEGTYYLWIKASTAKLENESISCTNAFYLNKDLIHLQEWDVSKEEGDNVKATLYENGVLTISGIGKMKDYEYSSRESNDFGTEEYRKKVTNVIIEKGITNIGKNAFVGCEELTNIKVANGNLNYSSVDGIVFNKENTKIINCPSKKVAELYEIPETITEINESAFNGCTGIKNIIIYNDNTTIGNNAFANLAATIYCRKGLTISNYEKVNSNGPKVTFNKDGNNVYTKKEEIQVTVAADILGVKQGSLYYEITNNNTETPEITHSFNSGDTINLSDLTGTYYIWVKAKTEKLENETVICSKAYYFDNGVPQAPTITGKVESENYEQLSLTNKNVTINIQKGEEPLSGTNKIEYSIDNGKTWVIYDENNKPEITEEGVTNVIAKVTNNVGTQSLTSEKFTIAIDKTAPIIEVKYFPQEEQKAVMVIIRSDEDLQKIEGSYYLLNTKKALVEIFNENIEQTITVKDIAGNETTVTITIDTFEAEFRYTKQTEGERNYILEVSPETTLENFRINIGKLKNAQVKTEEGTELTTGQYVGTGMTVEIEGTKYIIVVKGDSYKGDGIVNTFDLLAMFYHKVYSANEEENEYKLSEEKLKAADINENGEVDSIDLLKVFYHKEAIDNYKL